MPDPTITGRMGVYVCDSIEAVDHHLASVRQRLAQVERTGRFPDLLPKYRADLDKLLDRRNALTRTSDERHGGLRGAEDRDKRSSKIAE